MLCMGGKASTTKESLGCSIGVYSRIVRRNWSSASSLRVVTTGCGISKISSESVIKAPLPISGPPYTIDIGSDQERHQRH